MRNPVTFVIPLMLFASALPVHAQSEGPLPDWDHLAPTQRELLVSPLRERWNASPERRAKMLQHARHWSAMTPQQRAQARTGVDRFQTMSPEQREQARAAFERFRGMAPGDKRALRLRLRAMTPEQRAAWLQSQGSAAAPPDR